MFAVMTSTLILKTKVVRPVMESIYAVNFSDLGRTFHVATVVLDEKLAVRLRQGCP